MTNTIKIKGIKKAVGEYKRANAGGYYDPRYGKLMLDRSTGEIWTDEFYSLGHNSWNQYHNPAIVDLVSTAAQSCGREGFTVNMANVKAAAKRICAEYQNGGDTD